MLRTRSASPRVRRCRQPPGVEAGVARGSRRSRILVFSRAGGQGLLPSSLPLRSGWQEAGRSADSHGEGISKAKGEFPHPVAREDEALSSPTSPSRPSPPATLSPRRPRAQPGGPPPSTRTAGRRTGPVPSARPSPFCHETHRQHPPAATNRCPRPLVRVPWSLPQQPCTPPGAGGDAQRTTRRSSCSALPARWCRASRCLFWTFSKCCSSSV